MARLRFIMEQIREIEATRGARMEQRPETSQSRMILLLTRVIGVGIETADMLVHEILSRPLRDRKAVARYGVTP
jgi:transposase